MKKMLNYFFQGLLYVAPLGVTLYVIYFLFTVLDGSIRQYLEDWFDINIPGIGLLAIFLLISLLGFLGRSIIFRPIGKLVNKLIDQAPLFKLIYSSIGDLLKAFVGKERKFNKPVLVKVSMTSELEKIGFLTQEDMEGFGIKDRVAVYFPHSYNFSGEMFLVPRERVKPLDISPAEAMKFVVSGGAAMG